MSEFNDVINTVIIKGDIDEARRRWQPQYKDQRDDGGRTVLHYACMNKSGDQGDLVKLLVSLGCDIEVEDEFGWRPLHICASNDNLEAMRDPLEAGCSLSPITKYGETPLMIADKMEYHNCASLLRFYIEIQRPSMSNYVEGDLLGKGAFGSVYKCHDPKIDMQFSIKKVPLLETIADGKNGDIKALENDIQIYSKLINRRRILRYFGTAIHNGKMIIFMEYVSNGSLKDKLNKQGPFSIEEVIKYSRQILEGLEFLHGNNIIHRDIKAANILRDSDDDIKLVDFGIIKYVKTISRESIGFGAAGTPHWMAPEVIKAKENTRYEYRADVWSLGATILEMLTGKPPFHDLDTVQIVYQITKSSPVNRYFPSNLDKRTRSFLKKIFVSDPSKRADVKKLLESKFFQDS